MELEGVIAPHKKEQFGASYDTDYKVIEQCVPAPSSGGKNVRITS